MEVLRTPGSAGLVEYAQPGRPRARQQGLRAPAVPSGRRCVRRAARLGRGAAGFQRRRGHGVLGGVAAVPLMMILFKLYGLYDRDVKRISYSTVDDIPRLFHATVMAA